jgi:hypothetical protein
VCLELLGLTDMKYFIQIDADEQNEAINWLISEPLMLSVLFVCARRARKSIEPHPTLGLQQWEFLISQTETKVFGLKKTQHGILYRAINQLVKLKFIEKTGKQTGNANSAIYRYNKGNPITFGMQTGNGIDSEQVTDRYRIGNEQVESYKEKKEEKEKKEKEFIDLFNEFWNLYPNKKSKPKALLLYKKLADKHEDIIAGLKVEIEYRKWAENKNKTGAKIFVPFWKHPTTWLNGQCWLDEYTGEFAKQVDRIKRNEKENEIEAREDIRKKADSTYNVFKVGFLNKKFGEGNWSIFKVMTDNALIKELNQKFETLYPNEAKILFTEIQQ